MSRPSNLERPRRPEPSRSQRPNPTKPQRSDPTRPERIARNTIRQTY